MAAQLPDKIHLVAGQSPDDLSGPDRAKYNQYYAERDRRKDPSRANVAQEALDCLEELAAIRHSSSEAFTVYGYCLTRTVKPAVQEEKRLIAELRRKPINEIAANPQVALNPAAVKSKHGIPDFVEPPAEPPVELPAAAKAKSGPK